MANKHNISDYEEQAAQHEPPALSMEELVEAARRKPTVTKKYEKKVHRPRHINESDEKVIKEVVQDAVGVGVRAAETAMMSHHNSILDDLEELNISRDELHKLVELKHDLKRKEYFAQSYDEMSAGDFKPVMLEVMNEETGEVLPLFGERRALREAMEEEKANEDDE